MRIKAVREATLLTVSMPHAGASARAAEESDVATAAADWEKKSAAGSPRSMKTACRPCSLACLWSNPQSKSESSSSDCLWMSTDCRNFILSCSGSSPSESAPFVGASTTPAASSRRSRAASLKSSFPPSSSKPTMRSMATPFKNRMTHGRTCIFSFSVKNGASCSAKSAEHQAMRRTTY